MSLRERKRAISLSLAYQRMCGEARARLFPNMSEWLARRFYEDTLRESHALREQIVEADREILRVMRTLVEAGELDKPDGKK